MPVKKTTTTRKRASRTTTRRSTAKKKTTAKINKFPIVHTDSEKAPWTWHDALLNKVLGGGFILSILVVGTVGIGFYLVQASETVNSTQDSARYKELYTPVKVVVPSILDAEEQEQPLTVEVRNGTRRSGHASQGAADLAELSENITVTEFGNAARFSYPHSLVVDLSDGHSEVASIVQHFEAQWVSELPSIESESTADVVVILGE